MDGDPWRVALEHKGLAGTIARRFAGCGLEQEDLFHEGLIGLRRAAIEYDPGRGATLGWFARYYVLQAMSQAVRRCGRWARRVTDPDPDPVAPALYAIDADERASILRAVSLLPTRQRIVITRLYGLEGEAPRLVREVAAELGRDAKAVFRAERSALALLAAILNEGDSS
jgi:RNA polymerase sigma factor (sigma-70 family)